MKPSFVRRDLKKAAVQCVKTHYLTLFIVCFIIAVLGISFDGSFDIFNVKDSIIGWFVMPQTSSQTVPAEEDPDTGTGAVAAHDDEEITPFGLLLDLITGNIDQAERKAQTKEEEAIQGASDTLGRTNGIFAGLANNVGSGKFLVSIGKALSNMTQSKTFAAILFALGALLIYVAYYFFFRGVLKVIMARYFLESRTYQKIPLTRSVFLLQLRKWMNVAWVMLVRGVYQFLWDLTLVGGLIKMYSYSQVPYILAENPSMSAKEAITLSRQMMDGYKWKAFVLDLTLLGWEVLSVLTLGLSDLCFFNMYQTSIGAELYAWLRGRAKAEGNEYAKKLGDNWLYEQPAQAVLAPVYADVVEELAKPQVELTLPGIRGFFAKWFGFVLVYDKREREYEQDVARRNTLAVRKDELDNISYPWRLNPYLPPMPKKIKNQRFRFGFTIYYMRNYSLTSLILIFLFFSFFGWAWEVILHFIQAGEWVNRGVLHGPWLPIYGSGGILMLLFLKRLRSKPVLHFFGTIILCGIVEYFTGYACEVFLGRRYWNYDGYFLNLHGRICAEGLLAFGIGGILMVYFLAPLLDDLLRRVPMKVTIPLCVVLGGLFIADSIYSGKHPNTNTGEKEPEKKVTANEPERGTSPTESTAAAAIRRAGY